MKRERALNIGLVVCIAVLTIVLMSIVVAPNFSANPSAALVVYGKVNVVHIRDGQVLMNVTSRNLITNAGKDFIARQLGSTSPAPNGANYIALSTDSTTPSASDTTLPGEITYGGLARSQGTYSHEDGTNTFTIQKTFTATTSFTGVQKAGLFTAPTGGTMLAVNTFTPINLQNGDQLQITWTITIT